MAERKRIGLCYTYNENWIGGTYYIQNLVAALNTLAENNKPHIVLITNNPNDLTAAKKNLIYPHISFQLATGESNNIFQFINKVTRRLFNRRIFNQKINNLDAVFPYYNCIQQSLSKKKIYWIADFQEHFAPEFFSAEAIESRRENQADIQHSSEYLILSSNDALQHFKSLYPNHTVKVNVLPFAVTHPTYNQLDTASLLNKFSLPERYFICPNQFWKHKNQIVVLRAVAALKNKKLNVTVAFTGNTKDYRNPEYFNELKAYVKQYNLDVNIRFLGFIDRLEQLHLMSKAMAIIQPSLFEGWSTVVEDAKSMNKFLITSNISVHQEQLLNSTAQFFDPLNAQELADCLEQAHHCNQLPSLFENDTYSKNISAFGENFLKIVG